MAVEKITLNLIPTGETPTIHAAQFDKERAFQIELKEGEDDFSPTGYDIELQVRKVDNNIVTVVPSQVSSNIVTFLTTEQMTACSGTNLAELQISKNNMSIATLHFYLVVQRDVLAGGVTSASAIHDLEDQIAAIVPEVIGDEYYTADQVDEKIAEIPTFDPTNYYDKTETNGLLSQKANTSSLSTVAFTGSYDDLVDHPVIPDVSDYYTKKETYSQSEVNTLLSTKADISSLSTVATSGSYDDLSDKPTIPGNASVLPISASDSTNTKEYIDDKTTLVKSASGSLIHITDGGDNIPVKSLVSQIVAVQSGSGTPSPSNPRAISGFDNGIVTRCEKNLFDDTCLGSYTNEITLPIGTYYFKGFITTTGIDQQNTRFFWLDDTNTWQIITASGSYDNGAITWTGSVFGWESGTFYATVTLTKPVTFRMLCSAATANTRRVGIFLTNVDTFEPFNGTPYLVSFGQTVYGGHFDNKGNLVVTHSFIASYNGETINEPWISSMDNYVPNTLPSIGAEVVYPLTTPTTLSITRQDIPTLLGENNIYSNCGDTAIEYFTSSADGIAELIKAFM